MRKSSAAKRAASSPPVPARISTMTLFSSSGSFGRSRSFNSRSATSLRAESSFSSSWAICFMKLLVGAVEVFFDLFEFAVLGDDFKQIEKDLAGAHQMFLEAEDAEMKQMAHDEEKELSARKEVAERELKLLL